MKEKREMDCTITTLKDFRYAMRGLKETLQIYVQIEDYNTSLIEITEVMMILPKNKDDKPYIVLRAA